MATPVEFDLTAVIPTYQYANIQPTVHTTGETFEEARDKALVQMKSIWDQVAEGGKTLNLPIQQTTSASFVDQICQVSGTKVPFDAVAHKYAHGWTGGSTFAHRYKKPFLKEFMAGKMATSYGVKAEDILAMWAANSEASTSLGTAIHAALELYGKFSNLSLKIKGTHESSLHKNPILTDIVNKFYQGRSNEDAGYEIFVADAEKKFCGFIDRVLYVDRDKKIVRVQDYKTNPDINKKETILSPFNGVVDNTTLGAYWLQLSFYAYILAKAGYTVQGLDIFNLENGEWVTYQHDVVDISVTF